jgi:hypothetical protein
MTNFWDDPKYWRPIGAERQQSVTDQAGAARVTHFRSWNSCICEMCGKNFYSKRRKMGTKFCSPACRQKHYRQNKKLYL